MAMHSCFIWPEKPYNLIVVDLYSRPRELNRLDIKIGFITEGTAKYEDWQTRFHRSKLKRNCFRGP